MTSSLVRAKIVSLSAIIGFPLSKMITCKFWSACFLWSSFMLCTRLVGLPLSTQPPVVSLPLRSYVYHWSASAIGLRHPPALSSQQKTHKKELLHPFVCVCFLCSSVLGYGYWLFCLASLPLRLGLFYYRFSFNDSVSLLGYWFGVLGFWLSAVSIGFTTS